MAVPRFLYKIDEIHAFIIQDGHGFVNEFADMACQEARFMLQ
jgi:hypothetical protein